MLKKYAFIDRDGTLIFEPQDTFQIDSLEKLRILDGVYEGLRFLQDRGYELIMISNQNGLGTSSFLTETFELPHNRMLELFTKEGIMFSNIFICPHFPEDNCACRKPKIGLVEAFLKTAEIDPQKSFVYGDRDTDRLFAENLGIPFVQAVLNGPFQIDAVRSFITS